jgi:DNA modification methylase
MIGITMKTRHRLLWQNSQKMTALENASIALVVTSPPYPMIEMWDDLFCQLDPDIAGLFEKDSATAFERMHQQLDWVWNEVYRVLVPGGFACINIGDAVRSVNHIFRLYPNHARILSYCQGLGFNVLPAILWRKPTNAPNKFMGSGMLPAGAYVTLEHEYILILRKGGKREFSTPEQKALRHESAYFWEERNDWFSDVWFGIIGANQKMGDTTIRERSGAFPFEIPYRLINMYSVKTDTVLDPFCGVGTTCQAAIVAGRNSVGIEMNSEFCKIIQAGVLNLVPFANEQIRARLRKHLEFVARRSEKPLHHQNRHYGFPVVTRQESALLFHELLEVKKVAENIFEAIHADKLKVVLNLKE